MVADKLFGKALGWIALVMVMITCAGGLIAYVIVIRDNLFFFDES